jgi:DNA-directed RNA polymerase alpha subunit
MEKPIGRRVVNPRPEIDFLDIDARTYNCLAKAHIWSIAEIKAMSDDDLRKLPHFGRKCLGGLRAAVREYDERPTLRDEQQSGSA